MKRPPRIRRSTSLLEVAAHNRVLEVGYGAGLAILDLMERDVDIRVVGIDRSATMIERARRNIEAAGHNRVELRHTDLASMTSEVGQFDVIFAINVNAFWTNGSAEIAALKTLLASHGHIWLFYEPPAPAKIDDIIARLRTNMQSAGFAVTVVAEERAMPPFLAMSAALRS